MKTNNAKHLFLNGMDLKKYVFSCTFSNLFKFGVKKAFQMRDFKMTDLTQAMFNTVITLDIPPH